MIEESNETSLVCIDRDEFLKEKDGYNNYYLDFFVHPNV